MKKLIFIALSVMLLSTATPAFAGDNPLKAEEKRVNASFEALIPPDKIIGVDKFLSGLSGCHGGQEKGLSDRCEDAS